MPYLGARALKGLKQYKYQPGGYTVLDDIHQPAWNYVVKFFPMWLAPNLITLTGTCGLVIAYIVTALYLPEFEGEAPRWVYSLNFLADFSYLHLDCLDGKQARRTGSSSPLGQLFDHGCDALAVHLLLASVASTLNLGFNWKSILGAYAIMVPWLLAHWEEYHSGVMLYGNGYWGVTEANYLLALVHLFTAVTGASFWRTPISHIVNSKLPIDLPLNEALLVFVGIFSVNMLSGQFWRLLRKDEVLLAGEERGHKELGQQAALWHLAQLLGMCALGGIMLLEPHRTPAEARAVMSIFGLMYALQSSRLIMAHMAKEPFDIAVWPLLCMAAVIANSWLQLVDTAVFAWGIYAIVLAGYLHYTYFVVDEICTFLGINCLTIKQHAATS